MLNKRKLIISAIIILVLVGIIIAFNSVTRSLSSSGNVKGLASAGLPTMRSMNSLSFGGAAEDSMVADEISVNAPTTVRQTSIEKKIIKTGNLSIKVDKAETAAEAIANIAKVNQGDVYGSNFYKNVRGAMIGSITLHVPSNNFEKAFSELKEVAAELISESTNAQDVTEQYIDLEARLKNKMAEEVSFSELLKRSGTMQDILGVTRELARVRGEIEQLQGQKRYLDAQIDMSTISVNLTEDEEITPISQDWRPWQTFKASVKQLLINSQNFVNGLIRFVIVILPMLIIYGLILWLVVYLGRKAYKRFSNTQK